MQATLHSTSKVVTLNGVPARIWEGTTEGGNRIVAFITRVSPLDGNAEEFERELLQVQAPTPEIETFPSRLIL